LAAVIVVVLGLACCSRSPSGETLTLTLVCHDDSAAPDTTDNSSTMQIYRQRLTWDEKTFDIAAMTASRIRAVEVSNGAEANIPREYASDLDINRLDGATVWTTRISHNARRVLVRLCNGELTEGACHLQMQALRSRGGNVYACRPTANECSRYSAGDNVFGQIPMTCVRQAF
jgi:hypothetical protein